MGLYDYMSQSRDPKNMKLFGSVMTEMMDLMIQKMPTEAEEMIEKLESVRWDNFLTQKEADRIVSSMDPQAPWSREQWKAAMAQHEYPLEKWPCHNSCALYTTMNMIMSDSGETLSKYVEPGDMFEVVYELAIDRLCDKDKHFRIRHEYNL